MKTEFEFTLPTGYVDEQGQVHHKGMMRRSRAMDEILPMQDVRVQANPAYATVIILARVITRLGSLTEITPLVIENMFASDLSHLQTLYRQINSPEQFNTVDDRESIPDRHEAEASEAPEKELAPA